MVVPNDDEAALSPPPSVVDDPAPPPPQQQLLVIATRIHRGESSSTTIPTEDAHHIAQQIQQFCRFCQASHHDLNHHHHHHDNNNNNNLRTTVVRGTIAVDVTPNTDLWTIVQQAVVESTTSVVVEIHVIPVQPWGRFTPALNALLSDAAQTYQQLILDDPNDVVVVVGGAILYCSLETTTTCSSSSRAVRTLLSHMDYETTLVCGAALPGHDHITTRTTTTTTTGPTTTILNGRTSPWNTFAMWNIEHLAKIGFVTVSEGWIEDRKSTHDDDTTRKRSIAGIEEVATIALLQQLFHPHTQVMAKLISVQSEEEEDAAVRLWDMTSTTDPARQQWHEYKMQSKVSRARAQLRLLSLLPDNDSDNDDDTKEDPKQEPRLESSTRPGIVYHY